MLPVKSLIPSMAQTGRETCSKLAEELVLSVLGLQKSPATFTASPRRFLKKPRGGAVEQTADSNTPAFETPSSWAHLRDLATLDSVGPRRGPGINSFNRHPEDADRRGLKDRCLSSQLCRAA